MVTVAKRKKQKTSNYTGYKISNNDEIPELSERIDAKDFFDSFIKLRKPVKLDASLNDFLELKNYKIDKILNFLDYDSPLQIEKKYKFGFGSGLKRDKSSLGDLVKSFERGDDGHYLTTQYDFDDPDYNSEDDENNENEITSSEDIDHKNEEDLKNVDFEKFSDTSSIGSIDMENLKDDYEDDEISEGYESSEEVINDELNLSKSEVRYRLKELLQPPLTNRFDKIMTNPPFFSPLIPQQINLWMGYSGKKSKTVVLSDEMDLGKLIPGEGSSSGLHHDHADNLYILVSGKKRFTLYSPNDAEKLFTVGTIHKVFNNGIIDYERNEKAPNWKHIRDDGAIISEIARWKLNDSTISERTRKELQVILNDELEKSPGKKCDDLDPPSFSTVPPALLHIEEFPDEKSQEKLIHFANKYFPGFLNLNKLTVWLNPGEMLYLPCGWFHEVSSFGAEDASTNLDNVHIAINYWFIPPNKDDFNDCYEDNYWRDDWKLTEESLNICKRGDVEVNM